MLAERVVRPLALGLGAALTFPCRTEVVKPRTGPVDNFPAKMAIGLPFWKCSVLKTIGGLAAHDFTHIDFRTRTPFCNRHARSSIDADCLRERRPTPDRRNYVAFRFCQRYGHTDADSDGRL